MSFVGPAYTLVNRKAALDDSVNLYLAIMEAGGKSKATMESAPGYAQIAAPGIEVRGCFTTNDRTFWAIDDTLFEQMDAAGTLVSRGTLATSSGYVEFEYGTTQLVLVDGGNGYVLTLATNIFTQIGSDAFYGAARIAFLDNFFLFPRPDTGQFIKTALNDATSFDALDYATAESSPDDLVCPVVVQKRLLLFGQKTTEFWRDAGSADFPFEPGGGVMEVGCLAIHSPRVIDNTVFWLGGVGASGPGSVYRLNGYNAERVSDRRGRPGAAGLDRHHGGHGLRVPGQGISFYAINAPGLGERGSTTSRPGPGTGAATGQLRAVGRRSRGLPHVQLRAALRRRLGREDLPHGLGCLHEGLRPAHPSADEPAQRDAEPAAPVLQPLHPRLHDGFVTRRGDDSSSFRGSIGASARSGAIGVGRSLGAIGAALPASCSGSERPRFGRRSRLARAVHRQHAVLHHQRRD
jgi:hypothetical protein